jgi:transcriptional regulator with XRE-family HTH domain
MINQISKPSRRRGIVLTPQGFQKFREAKLITEINSKLQKSYTLEALSEKTGLTVNTLSKVMSSQVGVDKQTISRLFSAFNLTLEADDYRLFKAGNQDFDINSEYQSLTSPGGQIPLESPFYIERPPLESICYQEMSKLGALVIIKAPKQMGKSSLILRILNHAKGLGYQTVYLTLQLADLELFTSKKCFLQWFCARISTKLGLPNRVASVWDDQMGCKSNATDYLENYILKKLNCPLVIAIDEMNQLLTHSQLTSEVFSLLRSWSEMAKHEECWQKLRFLIAYSTDVSKKSRNDFSLLNTGLSLDLPLFTPDQVRELARRYGLHFSDTEIKNLINSLGGHPYQVQLAFYQLQKEKITFNALLNV